MSSLGVLTALAKKSTRARGDDDDIDDRSKTRRIIDITNNSTSGGMHLPRGGREVAVVGCRRRRNVMIMVVVSLVSFLAEFEIREEPDFGAK